MGPGKLELVVAVAGEEAPSLSRREDLKSALERVWQGSMRAPMLVLVAAVSEGERQALRALRDWARDHSGIRVASVGWDDDVDLRLPPLAQWPRLPSEDERQRIARAWVERHAWVVFALDEQPSLCSEHEGLWRVFTGAAHDDRSIPMPSPIWPECEPVVLGPSRWRQAVEKMEPMLTRLAELNAQAKHALEKTPDGQGLALLDHWQKAMDTFANERRDNTIKGLVRVQLLATVATACFIVSEHFQGFTSVFGGLFLAFAGLAWGMRWWWKRKGVEERYRNARLLGEALRVQLAWARAGVQACVADMFPYMDGHGHTWARNLLRAMHAHAIPVQPPSAQNLRALLDGNGWLENQRAYFAKKLKGGDSIHHRTRLDAYERKIERAEWAERWGMRLGGAAVAIYEGSEIVRDQGWQWLQSAVNWLHHTHVDHGLVITGVIGMGGALLVQRWVEALLLHEERHSYKLMLDAFDRARQEIKDYAERMEDGDAHAREQAVRVLLELGGLAVQESVRWVRIHEERSWLARVETKE